MRRSDKGNNTRKPFSHVSLVWSRPHPQGMRFKREEVSLVKVVGFARSALKRLRRMATVVQCRRPTQVFGTQMNREGCISSKICLWHLCSQCDMSTKKERSGGSVAGTQRPVGRGENATHKVQSDSYIEGDSLREEAQAPKRGFRDCPPLLVAMCCCRPVTL